MAGSFWIGGLDAYRAGLEKQHEAMMAELCLQLQLCEDKEKRTDIEAEISRTEAEHKAKLRQAGKGIF